MPKHALANAALMAVGAAVFQGAVGVGAPEAGPRRLEAWRAGETESHAFPNPSIVGFVPVKSVRVVDLNGDLDGYPDTNETVELHLTVHSPARSVDQTNVVIELGTADPKIDCILPSAVAIGSLSAGADAEAVFRIHIHPRADRASGAVMCNNPGPGGGCSNFVDVAGGCFADTDCHRTVVQEYAARISVRVRSDQYPFPPRDSQTFLLDLDLNSIHPSTATTTFTEGFESAFGFGNFTFQNLDADKATNALSDGYRCQYTDPDFPNSNAYGDPQCYLGFAAGQIPPNDWHLHTTASPDGGRAFSGNRSAHYGIHTPGNAGLDTSGLSQMDALRTKTSIHLAARICENDPAANKRSCTSSSDCLAVGGGACVSARPELSFKHQMALPTNGPVHLDEGQAVDRGVVYAQIAGSAVWEKIFPSRNIYNSYTEYQFGNCLFDPIDDGNDEDSTFDPPLDPQRRFGPSTTCYPEFAFSELGDTFTPFAPTNLRDASDGPGLAGSLGIGTWVESKFDLSRFRGRSVNIRFLVTSIKSSDHGSHEDLFDWNPVRFDDGWYIDDIRVTQTLGATSPSVTLDDTDNAGLTPGNVDGDARGDECDCAPLDPMAFAVPGEVKGERFAADKLRLTWPSALPTSGSGTVHDVLRGDLLEFPVGAGPSEACLASGIQTASATDAAVPATGGGVWYLIRARNACGIGTYGFRSNGTERTSLTCP